MPKYIVFKVDRIMGESTLDTMRLEATKLANTWKNLSEIINNSGNLMSYVGNYPDMSWEHLSHTLKNGLMLLPTSKNKLFFAIQYENPNEYGPARSVGEEIILVPTKSSLGKIVYETPAPSAVSMQFPSPTSFFHSAAAYKVPAASAPPQEQEVQAVYHPAQSRVPEAFFQSQSLIPSKDSSRWSQLQFSVGCIYKSMTNNINYMKEYFYAQPIQQIGINDNTVAELKFCEAGYGDKSLSHNVVLYIEDFSKPEAYAIYTKWEKECRHPGILVFFINTSDADETLNKAIDNFAKKNNACYLKGVGEASFNFIEAIAKCAFAHANKLEADLYEFIQETQKSDSVNYYQRQTFCAAAKTLRDVLVGKASLDMLPAHEGAYASDHKLKDLYKRFKETNIYNHLVKSAQQPTITYHWGPTQ